ncbi:TonB-dependent receptor [Sphingomonas sp. AR_OL41]|uniref:TonB-dependent receptor n=1 Tax=Sphingomonas sp. AR_OL41 TaxID=3042729 RepID=UPI0024813438|nr:TonB-dependent receptor [Sphingomonas sp. AR_OL41]MDH7971968.1 TonB-dependent receptor [Sphingomonas sp. AR_OL41]
MTKSHDDANQAGRRVRLLALLLASGASVAAMTPAMAQTTPPPPAADNQLADVVVTASRSGAESLQKVPIAVSVVNVDQITKSGQGNLSDLAKFTPSLSITEGAPGYNKFNMRGLSTGGYASSDTSDRTLVAVYLDDTPISVQGQTPDLKVYDLERVEILRGPQGTLYGAGSMAGTVRFVTAKPSMATTFGTAEVGAATTEHGAASYNLRGMINLPIVSDTLAVRANVYVGRDGGYIDNIGLRNTQNANSNNTAQGRVAVRWKPVNELIVDASFTYERSVAHGLNQGLSGLAPYTVSSNGPEGTDDRFRLYTLGFDYDAGFANIIATGAYTDRAIGFDASPEPQIGYFFQDYGSGLPISSTTYPLFQAPTTYNQAITNKIPAELYQIDQKLKDYMGEFRLVGKEGGPFKWTVGAFYEQQTRHLRQDIPTPGFDTLSYMNYFYGPFATPGGKYDSKLVDAAFQSNDIFSGLQDTNEHQFALYADGTLHLGPVVDLTAGLRYFNFKESYYLFEGGVYGVVNHVPLETRATLKSNGVNPRANVTFHVSDDFMVYGEAAKGFRYGGANQPVPLGSTGVAGQCTTNLAAYGYTAAPLTFGPDKLWNYTIGEKAKLAGGRVTLNASAYYINWSDVQTRLRLDCSYFFTDNKGKITSKGVELETMVKASPEVTLVGSASYNSSKAKGDIPTVGAFDGDRTPYFPAWTASAAVFYDRNVGSGSVHAQLSYQYQSEQYTTFNNFATKIVGGVLTRNGASSSYAVIPATNNVSASLAYDIGKFEIGVYGNNLFDGVKVTNVGRATYYKVYQAGDRITLARPRTIGIRAKVKF